MESLNWELISVSYTHLDVYKRQAVRPAFQGQGYGAILIAALKDVAVQKEKEAIWLDCSEDLLSYFAQQGFRDEAESDRGVHMVWER